MPLYFKELEKAFINWYKLYNKKQSSNNPVSLTINRNIKKFAKDDLLYSILKLLKNIENYNVELVPTSKSDEVNIYIKVEPKKIQSKL